MGLTAVKEKTPEIHLAHHKAHDWYSQLSVK